MINFPMRKILLMKGFEYLVPFTAILLKTFIKFKLQKRNIDYDIH
jgi:hypothetical protein